MKKATKRMRYVAVANLFNLNVQDVVQYVNRLHRHIKKQNKRINKLLLKIRKMKFLSKLDEHFGKTTSNLGAVCENSKDFTAKTDGQTNSPAEAPLTSTEPVQDFVNEIKAQAMQNSFQQAGFIFEPVSGLFYDTKSGLYFSPEHDLYYNGNDANWYRLNPRTNEFIFHSGTEASQAAKKEVIDEDEAIRKILADGRQPVKAQESSKCDEKVKKDKSRRRYSTSSSSDSSVDSRSRKKKRRSRSHSKSQRSRSRSRQRDKKKKRRDRSRSSNKEDGELGSSDDSDDYQQKEEAFQDKFRRKRKKKKGNDYEEIAKKYPPSLRLIVIESDKMDIGKLFVVTFKGGTLGREGDHDVIIPDVNVSKNHLKLFYNHKKGIYQFTDRSRNGTLLDGVQVSLLSQEESDASDLVHGSILELAKTKLLCHVHEGLTTCSECEPYNYVRKTVEEPKASDEPQPSNLSHKEQLKLLQKRYGLATEKYLDNPSGSKNKNYEDRAEKRRVKVGSSHGSVKTEQASVNTSISSDNKGFKLLSKMGWSEGKSIGKSQEGIKEPIQVNAQQGTTGLGSESMPTPNTSFQGKSKKNAIWNKTMERYNNIKKPDIFDDGE